jgi:arylformamidase
MVLETPAHFGQGPPRKLWFIAMRPTGTLAVNCFAPLLAVALLLGCSRKTGEAAAAGSVEGRSMEPLDEMQDADNGTLIVPKDAQQKADVSYGSDPSQTMDVYIPQHPNHAPVVFMVHGGAWLWGDKRHSRVVNNKAARWIPKGYIFVSVNYRLAPAADPLQQVDDVAKALAAAQAQAASWGGDPARFLVMGHSAGAHLVSLLASDPSFAAAHGVKPWLGTVALDSAAFDVERIMQRRHFRFYDRVFKNDPAYWRSASPLTRLRSKPVPFLAVCSSERPESCRQAQAFVDKAVSFGGRAQIVPVAKSHAQINFELGLPGDYTKTVEAFMQSLGLP